MSDRSDRFSWQPGDLEHHGVKDVNLIDEVDAVTKNETEFLLSCLREGKFYQSRIARVMRTASEAFHFVRYHFPDDEPKYRNSTELKKINSFVSREASLLIVGTRKDFLSGTVLEHPMPLDKMYQDLEATQTPLTPENIVETLGRWPLITVTTEEDRRLEHAGWDDPAHRYAKAKIEVGRVKTIKVGGVKKIKFGTDPGWKSISLSDRSSWGEPTP